MHRLYTLAIYLATPLALFYLLVRGLGNSDYLRRWPERFGFIAADSCTRRQTIIIHAASVGEVTAASPLIQALMARYPDHKLIVTTLTPTGSRRVKALFGERVGHCYVPLELPGAVRRFYKHFSPRLLLVLETEIWPQLYHGASATGVPIVIANARLSEKSLRSYLRMGGRIGRWIGGSVILASRIGAQSAIDRERLMALGVAKDRIELTGNLKFDVDVDPNVVEAGAALRALWGRDRPVLVAGSTRGIEHTILATAWMTVLETFPNALLVMAPRHPESFGQAVTDARRAGLETLRFSSGTCCTVDTHCMVIDSMGDLLACYAAGDVAFVGGTLAAVGGHNALEPAALGKPVLLGPNTWQLGEIAEKLLAGAGALSIPDGEALPAIVTRLLAEPARRIEMGGAARRVAASGRGATARTIKLIEETFTGKATRAAD